MKIAAVEYYRPDTAPAMDRNPREWAELQTKWTVRDLVRDLKRARETVLITCGPDLQKGGR